MSTLTDLINKRNELYITIEAYQNALISGDTGQIDTTKNAAIAKGDEYAKLLSQVRKNNPELEEDDLFSNVTNMNENVREDISYILQTGNLPVKGLKLKIDTTSLGSNPTNVATKLKLGSGTNAEIDWGDGNITLAAGLYSTHYYSVPGEYIVEIKGTIGGGDTIVDSSNPFIGQLIEVVRWGDITINNHYGLFYRCFNLTAMSQTDSPNFNVDDTMDVMFKDCTNFNSDISHWDVSNVKSMSQLFDNATSFNQPLNSWDMSNVSITTYMFRNATSFNQPLDQWTISSVDLMQYMFNNASVFNQDISGWDVSGVRYMHFMFNGASSFDQDLSHWDVSNVTLVGGYSDFIRDFKAGSSLTIDQLPF